MKNPVLVTTVNRGVFFGDLKETKDTTVTLTKVQNCLYWRGLKGFLDLATSGPNAQCRVGAVGSEIVLFNVTSITKCTKEAVENWAKSPW